MPGVYFRVLMFVKKFNNSPDFPDGITISSKHDRLQPLPNNLGSKVNCFSALTQKRRSVLSNDHLPHNEGIRIALNFFDSIFKLLDDTVR